MPAVSITDHGNLFGAVQFYKKAKQSGIKPIIGIETYVAPGSRHERKKGDGTDRTFHLILLAKDCVGYTNLMKLSSIGYQEGFYYKPRIDKEALAAHAEGLIVCSSCIKGEVPYKLIHDDYEGAKEAALFYQNLFGEDYYLEIQDHGIPEEKKAMPGIFDLAKELGIPVIATNDTHYLTREHAEAQDILLCIQTGKDYDDPNRMKFSSQEIYFKSPDEMAGLFRDHPEVLSNTLDVAAKCNMEYDFKAQYFPSYEIPENETETDLNTYFEKLCWEGAKERYGELTEDIQSRLKFEMDIIEKMGYVAYFLITADFIKYARDNGIPVGPGRGSAAGSMVSYVLRITNVEPLAYNLLFERFLNPERVSMPDIDIDFCYERREDVIDYVRKKYGGDRNVTQIITFGSMNARGVIRDVGRVLKIPYGDVDQIAKLIPAFSNLSDAYEKVKEFREVVDSNDLNKKLLTNARVLEGLARHASTHAAGVVIAPGDLTDYVPLYKPPNGETTTQFDMKSLEQVGLLKMDFLGLRTLTVIDHAVKALKRRGVEIDIDKLPLDDEATYKIFANGETVGVFQFESDGMQDYLKKLGPTRIQDLIAMNALYRPGPMEWIGDFIDRKHGRIPMEYPHPMLEDILKETYGVIVYQEQVMQIASKLANFSLGGADILRRAMGKKDPELMQQQKIKFVEGAAENQIPKKKAEEIYDLILKFAGYGFNKSHATCYSIVAYQTAYLKAHYPVEFMAANLTSEMGNIDRVVILIEECKRMEIAILPPDVNTSVAEFMADGGAIRYGLGAVKNVGKGAIASIVEAREKEGRFQTIFDYCSHLNLRLVNKKVMESLIQVGAMDTLEGNRAQKMAILEKAIACAQSTQQSASSGQFSIFEEATEEKAALYPDLPDLKEWPQADALKREKDLLGIYLSGHPLEKHRDDIEAFADPKISALQELNSGKSVRLCGIVTEVKTRLDKKNNTYAFLRLEDFTGSVRLLAFSDAYGANRELLTEDRMVCVEGKLDKREDRDEINVIVNSVIPLEEMRSHVTGRLCIKLDNDFKKSRLDDVKQLLKQYPGDSPVYFYLDHNGCKNVALKSRSITVHPDQELLDSLREILGEESVKITC